MDLYDTKRRISEAFVESVFRRARYEITPFKGEPGALRIGRETFSPNFSISRNGDAGLLVEVQYRPSIRQFLLLENQRRDLSIFVLARRHWPELHVVLVTDHPEPGRSCFQVIDGTRNGAGFATVDLADVAELGIFRHNVEEHERLLLRLFDLLSQR